MKRISFFLIFLFSMIAFGAKIQQQGIKTSADCIAAGATNATCLPLDSQIYVTGASLNDQLSVLLGSQKILNSTAGASPTSGTFPRGDGSTWQTSTLTIPNTATAPCAMVVNTNNQQTCLAATTSNRVLLTTNGSSLSMGQVDLATAQVTGTLQLGNGGTANNALNVTTGNVLHGDGTKVLATGGTTGNLMTWNGGVSGAPGNIPFSNNATWTVTATNVSNTSSLSGEGYHLRIGNYVYWWVNVAFTASNASVEFRVSIPVASNFASSGDVRGGHCASLNTGYGRVLADTTNDELTVQSSNATVAAITFFCSGSYRVI